MPQLVLACLALTLLTGAASAEQPLDIVIYGAGCLWVQALIEASTAIRISQLRCCRRLKRLAIRREQRAIVVAILHIQAGHARNR